MQGKIEVLEAAASSEAPGLAHAVIDKPNPASGTGMVADRWALDVRGSVVGSDAPVVRVELESGGAVIHATAANAPRPALAAERRDLRGAADSGFYATLGALDLAQQFEVSLYALLEDGSRVPFGRIAGRRARVVSPVQPRLRPLMVTGPGRSGSTVFMQMLSAHPGVIAWPPFDEEARVATYWIDVLRTLARPDSFLRQVAPAGNLNDDWWLGRRDPRPRSLSDADMQAWLSCGAVEDITSFALGRVDELYARLAARTGHGDAVYFAEKLRNDIVSELAWELYEQAREIVLVRDPRDVLCSILASSRKRGEQPPPQDVIGWIDASFAGRIAAVADSWRRRAGQAHLLRYEDLMLDPRPTLAGVLAYLGLEADTPAVDAMLAAAERGLPAMERHRTTPDPAASIGRWERELEPRVVEECERVLGDALEMLGYRRAAAGSARPT
jgi:hypothetical protein